MLGELDGGGVTSTYTLPLLRCSNDKKEEKEEEEAEVV